MQNILNDDESDEVINAFSWLTARKNGDQITSLLKSTLNDRKAISEFFDNHDIDDIADILGVKSLTKSSVFDTYFGEGNFKSNIIHNIAKIYDENGTSSQREKAGLIYNFLDKTHDVRSEYYDAYRSFFLTDKNTIRAVPKPLVKAHPLLFDEFNDEANRLLNYEDKINSLNVCDATQALLRISHKIIDEYNRLKQDTRRVDYDDLIDKTQELLSGDIRQWVLFKLDFGIEHILVDEAQDTSPQQWDIILALLEEFFSGTGTRDESERSLFVVGDNKQSIFSFQGANPDVFNKVHEFIEDKAREANAPWENIPMNTSFRSTPAILSVVDSVFQPNDLRQSLTQNPDAYRDHSAYRQGQSGKIELWPLYKAPPSPPITPWQLPTKIVENFDSQSQLASRIAGEIHEWISSKTVLKSVGRPIEPGDIMILVRRRNAMVNHLIRALKSLDIPVSGADRLVVSNHIAVRDMMSALSFVLSPNDDLNLACLLKSPLVGMNDEELEVYAHGRKGTLWNAIKTNAPKSIGDWLSALLENLTGKNVFATLSDILNQKTHADKYSGWQSMMSRLGADAIDPLEELLSMAQDYDSKHPAKGIQGFVHYMGNNTADIKREMDHGDNQVRIMTIHASKGLQAPIVILPDTVSLKRPSASSEDGFIWYDNKYPLWYASAAEQNDLIHDLRAKISQQDMDEYYRLLYVALTRAKDRLVVCGALNMNAKDVSDLSWYAKIRNGLTQLNSVSTPWGHDENFMIEGDANSFIYETGQVVEPKTKDKNDTPDISVEIPKWMHGDLATEQYPPRVLKPSQDETHMVAVRSPLSYNDDTYRFRRGLLTHSLLQYLPDIDHDNRRERGMHYLEKQAPDISNDMKQGILGEAMAVITNPEFAPFFAAGSYAEVPITGMVTRDNEKIDIISGQIDRLLVTDDTVWIVDFKSNRPPPRDPSKTPVQYRNQLKAYKTLMSDIYPDHEIRCALLWTDGPFMSELKDL